MAQKKQRLRITLRSVDPVSAMMCRYLADAPSNLRAKIVHQLLAVGSASCISETLSYVTVSTYGRTAPGADRIVVHLSLNPANPLEAPLVEMLSGLTARMKRAYLMQSSLIGYALLVDPEAAVHLRSVGIPVPEESVPQPARADLTDSPPAASPAPPRTTAPVAQHASSSSSNGDASAGAANSEPGEPLDRGTRLQSAGAPQSTPDTGSAGSGLSGESSTITTDTSEEPPPNAQVPSGLMGLMGDSNKS